MKRGRTKVASIIIWAIVIAFGIIAARLAVSVYENSKINPLTDSGTVKNNIAERGYKIEDWVTLFISGEISLCDLYTNEKLAFNSELAKDLGVSYEEYDMIMSAVVDSVLDIQCIETNNEDVVKLVVRHRVYKQMDTPVMDFIALKKYGQEYKLGRMVEPDFVDAVEGVLKNSMRYTIKGNGEAPYISSFTVEVTETKDGITGIKNLFSKLYADTNVEYNLSVFLTQGEDVALHYLADMQ